eukprot:gnl/TRDRNA2_/TRDRNA2_190608_c0_seq1.p1 gnl/TRDRNA2_/TRDRNA2_190608_c0~~gnl/TRDRNA2_/TRDRNA2_190608_c0_seq1.p1  ORF type:complete len:165 (-),score=52.81 gnl/TRDRNA2_/TRDRNA2_190608_c0_seq1:326-820(-)
MDCTDKLNEAHCVDHGVTGYPFLKYYNKNTGDTGLEYTGDRSHTELKKAIKTIMTHPCNVATGKNCNLEEKNYLEEVKTWTSARQSQEKEKMDADYSEAEQELKRLIQVWEEKAKITEEAAEAARHQQQVLDKLSGENRMKSSILRNIQKLEEKKVKDKEKQDL